MVSEFIRRSHYNESVCRKKSRQRVYPKQYHSKVSVLSGRYFKLTTDKEAESKERKISDVGIFPPYTHSPVPTVKLCKTLMHSYVFPGLELDTNLLLSADHISLLHAWTLVIPNHLEYHVGQFLS